MIKYNELKKVRMPQYNLLLVREENEKNTIINTKKGQIG